MLLYIRLLIKASTS